MVEATTAIAERPLTVLRRSSDTRSTVLISDGGTNTVTLSFASYPTAPRLVVMPYAFVVETTDLEETFNHLASKWHDETDHLSSTTAAVTNLNYLRIIALGRRAVPLILRDLDERGGQWHLALQAITGEWPVPEDARGDIERMNRYWMDWAHQANSA